MLATVVLLPASLTWCPAHYRDNVCSSLSISWPRREDYVRRHFLCSSPSFCSFGMVLVALLPFSAADFIAEVPASFRSPPCGFLESFIGVAGLHTLVSPNPCIPSQLRLQSGSVQCARLHTPSPIFFHWAHPVCVDPSMRGRVHCWPQGASLLLTKLNVFAACRTIGRVTNCFVMDTTRIHRSMPPSSATQNWVCDYAASPALRTFLLSMPYVLAL